MYYYKADSHVTSLRSRKTTAGTSLTVQWLRCCASSAGAAGSIPDQGTRTARPKNKAEHCQTQSLIRANLDEKKQHVLKQAQNLSFFAKETNS